MQDDFKPPHPRFGSLEAAPGSSGEKQTPPPTNTFHTPEEVAANDDHATASPLLEAPQAEPLSQEKHSGRRRLAFHWPPGKKEIIISAAVLILVVGGVTTWLVTRHHAPKVVAATTTKVVTAKPKPAPTTVPSDLTGLPVAPSVNSQPVTAVMVENTPDARPQSGLSQAGVVFEAVAEGGVTRFMALYQDTAPTNVGPIRSARPYYIQWSMGFDAGYAHVGGSTDALADIKAWGVRDLDEFYNGSYYHRISSRAAPHNVYTGIPTLNQLEAAKGYTTSTYTSWPRKAAAPSKSPTAQTIKLIMSSSTYDDEYSYDASTNSYNRSEDNAPLMDANTNTQISPKVVIAIVVPETQGARDTTGAYYSDYNVIGSGAAYVFQDGNVTIGQWSKSSNTSQILFTLNGQPLKLDAGQTWVTAITSSKNVSYSP